VSLLVKQSTESHRRSVWRSIVAALLVGLACLVVLSGCSGRGSREREAAALYRDACRKLIAAGPRRTGFQTGLAAAARPRVPTDVLRMLERAVELDPDQAQYRLLLWWFLPEGSPRWAAQAAWLDDAGGPEGAVYLQALASRSLEAGGPKGFTDAIELLGRAGKLEPRNALIDYQMAGVYVLSGDLDSAYKRVAEGNSKGSASAYGVRLDEEAAAERPILAFHATTMTLAAPFRTIVEALTAPGLQVPGTGLPYDSCAFTLADAGDTEGALRVCDEAIRMCSIRALTRPQRHMHRVIDALQAREIAYANKAAFLRRFGMTARADEADARSRADTALLQTFDSNGWVPIAAGRMDTADIARLLGRSPRGSAALVAIPVAIILPLVGLLGLMGFTFWRTGARVRSGFGIASLAAAAILVGLIVKFSLIFLGGWNPYTASIEREAAHREADWTAKAIRLAGPYTPDSTPGQQ
jgi:tetratricopeptide (TPR) repeat protein